MSARDQARCDLVEVQAARLAMVSWISGAELCQAVERAYAAALAKSLEAPDPGEFDSTRPAEWYRADLFAEDLSDLVRLEIFKLALARGVEGASHHVEQLLPLVHVEGART